MKLKKHFLAFVAMVLASAGLVGSFVGNETKSVNATGDEPTTEVAKKIYVDIQNVNWWVNDNAITKIYVKTIIDGTEKGDFSQPLSVSDYDPNILVGELPAGEWKYASILRIDPNKTDKDIWKNLFNQTVDFDLDNTKNCFKISNNKDGLKNKMDGQYIHTPAGSIKSGQKVYFDAKVRDPKTGKDIPTEWDSDKAKIAIYAIGKGEKNAWTPFMTVSEKFGAKHLYETVLPQIDGVEFIYHRIIVVRFSEAAKAPGWDANNANPKLVWNQTKDIYVADGKDLFFTYNHDSNNNNKFWSGTEELALYEANLFGEAFLTATSVCDKDGVKNNITEAIWTDLTAKYSKLSTRAMEIVKTVKANENGNAIERAMARYDFIVTKYTSMTDFLTRRPAPSGIGNIESFESNSVLIISLISVTIIAFGALMFIVAKRSKATRN